MNKIRKVNYTELCIPIEEDDLFKEDGKGREDTFHITVKYGLLTEKASWLLNDTDILFRGGWNCWSSGLSQGKFILRFGHRFARNCMF